MGAFGFSKKQIIILCVVLVVCLALASTIAYFVIYEPTNDPKDRPFDTGDTNTTYTLDDQASFNFLVLGYDKASMSSDVIMVVNYNIDNSKLSVMQIPRDTRIDIDDRFAQMSNAFCVYYWEAFWNNSAEPVKEATQKVVKLIESNLCIDIKFYATMSLEGFDNIVDTIGGVEIDVPFDMDYEDPEQDLYIHIKAGQQVLNGKQAEGFVRFRSSYNQGDLGRGNAQKIFLAAFAKKVLSSITVSNLTKIGTEVLKNLTTDMKTADFVYFGKNALNLKLADITMMTLPGGTCSDQARYVLNRKNTLGIINEYFNIYTEDISDSIFDMNKVFCPKTDYDEIKYYDDTPEFFSKYTAQSVVDDSIDIKTK